MGSRSAAEVDEDAILAILESDRTWCAYALADLAPPWRAHADWSARAESLVLVYRGLSPPVLFGTGDPQELKALLEEVPSEKYWYTLRPTDFVSIEHRMHDVSRMRMWRMHLINDSTSRWLGSARRLGEKDVERVTELFAEHADRPDAYQPSQVENGIYFGIDEDDGLASVAGTHVLDRDLGVAAVGNVFTAPKHRRRGYAIQATAAVVRQLSELEIETVVLNVEMDNQPAIDMYQNLGFMPYCGFYEGVAVLS